MDAPFFLPQFAAQAVIDLEKTVKDVRRNAAAAGIDLRPHLLSLRAMKGLAGLIREAAHVVLPANGEIYRDNQWGGAPATPAEVESFQGLPAPVTCFEYPWTHPKHPADPAAGTKRITVIADHRQLIDLHGRTHEGSLPPDFKATVQVFSVYFHEGLGEWQMYPGTVNLSQPLEVTDGAARPGTGKAHWAIRASYRNLDSGEYADPNALTSKESKCIGEFYPDITAAIQCCHALRAGASFEEKRETSSSRRWKFDKRGVGGFTYHVLKIPTHPREGHISSGGGGTHASPRLHIRRRHIRTLPSGALTFVRECFVGEQDRGVVQKTYEVVKR